MTSSSPQDLWLALPGAGNGPRDPSQVAFMTSLLGQHEAKINHFDTIRQQNLWFALAAFGALVGFATKVTSVPGIVGLTIALLALMLLFFLMDHRYHRYSQGWQGTRRSVVLAIAAALKDSSSDVRFLRYDVEAERTTRVRGWHSRIYLLLIAGALVGPAAASILGR